MDRKQMVSCSVHSVGNRCGKHNNRDDLVLYLEAWAGILETELPIEPQPEPTEGLLEPLGDSKVA